MVLLENINNHANDVLVTFKEDLHLYFYDNVQVTFSVTQFIEFFFTQFDCEIVVERMTKGKYWPRPEYTHANGVPFTRADVLNKWADLGLDAREKGSALF
jgi:hypothetical protein